jgi:hypothetical protein
MNLNQEKEIFIGLKQCDLQKIETQFVVYIQQFLAKNEYPS